MGRIESAEMKSTGKNRLSTSKEKRKEYMRDVARGRTRGANHIAESQVGILLIKTKEIAKMY